MVLLYDLGDRSWIDRDVIKNKHLAERREGFYALRESFRSGRLYQLNGKERILIAKF